MGIVIDRTNVDGKWFEYEDAGDGVEFKIQPFKASLRSIRPGDDLTSVLHKQSIYCLIGWKGIKDVNGEEVKYTEDNKKFLLDYDEDLAMWVSGK